MRRSVGGVNLTVHGAFARLKPAVASGGSSNADIGVKNIAINGPDGRLPGGASAGLISGLLPVCHARGARVYDETSAFEEALLTEKRVAAQGLLDTTFTYNPPDPTFLITGAVDVGHNGAPRADITLYDVKSGESRHFTVAGDPESWDDLGGFMRHIGSSIGNNIADHQIACDMASQPPPPPPPSSTCHASKGTVCVAFAGDASGHLTSPHTFGTYYDMKDVTWDLTWTAKFKGYGVPTELSPSSHADGSGSVTYSNGSTCQTGFALFPAYAPSLAQGPPYNSKHELTIEVPNPLLDSAGTGTGNPSVGPTTSCPARLSAGAGNFKITVPLAPHTVRYLPIQDDDKPISNGSGGTGTSSFDGTIVVEVG